MSFNHSEFDKMELEIKHNKPICNNHEFEDLICSWINKFGFELNAYYQKTNDNELFSFNERALLGFFANGLIRCDNSFCNILIQEFSVYNKGKRNIGRMDLLISDSNTNFIVECKRNIISDITEKKWNDFRNEKYLNKVVSQAKKYYKAEIDFYKNKTTYLVALVFDNVYSKDFENYLISLNTDDSKIANYFYSFFYSESIKNNGLSVYGLIKLMNN